MAVRWIRRIAVGAVLVVVIAGLVAWAASRSAWGREEVRHLIEQQAARALNGELTIGRVSGSLVGGVTLSDVRFVHAGREAVSASAVEVQFSLWGWWRGRRDISLIRLVHPIVHISEQHNRWSVAEWARAGSPSTGPPTMIRVATVDIADGQLFAAANESAWRLPAEIREINGQFALTIGDGARIDIAQLGFATAPGATAFRAHRTTGTLTFAADTHLERVRVESDAGSLLVSDGRIGSTSPHPIALTAELDRFDGKSWRAWTPLLDTIDLTASGTAVFSGDIEHLGIRTTLTTSAGQIAGDARVASQPDGVRISGTVNLTKFDAQHVTQDPLWKSDVTTRAQFTVESSGTPSAWVVDATLADGPIAAFGAVTTQLSGHLRYAANVVTFETTAAAYGATARGTGTIHVGRDLVIDVSGEQLADLDPRHLPTSWGFLPLNANVDASAFTVHYTSAGWSTRATLNDSVVEGATLSAGTEVEVTGARDSIAIRADGDVRALDGRRMGRATGLTGLDDPLFVTDMNGHMTVSGQGRTLSDIDLTVDARLRDSIVAVGARVPDATVHYTRRSHLNTAHVIGNVSGLNPEKLGASAALASDINGHTDFTATWRDDVTDVTGSVTAQGTLNATASTISTLPILGGTVTGEWREGRFTVERAELRNRGASVTAQGPLAVTRGSSNVRFEVKASDVGPLEPWTGRKASGAATGTGTIGGTFDLPRVTATFASSALSDPALGTFDALSGHMDVVFPDWILDKMRGDITVQANRWTGDTGPLADTVSAQGTFSTRMHVTSAVVQGTARGTLVRATLSADWERETTADISTLEATRGNQQWLMAPSSGLLRVSTTHVTVTNVQFTNGAQRLTASGQVALSQAESGGDASDQLSIRATAMDLASLDEFLALSLGARGVVSGDATLLGRLSDPRGRLTLSGHDLVLRGYRIADAGGSIDLASGAAMAALTMTQPDGVALTVNGRAPLSWLLPAGVLDPSVPSPTWDLVAVSDPINLNILGAVTPQLTEIGGQAIVDLRVVGAAETPTVTGTVAIGDGSFKVPSAGAAFSQVTADLGLGTDRITVRRFTAHDKRDHLLKVTGQLAVKARQIGEVDMHVEADRVTVVDNPIGSIELSSLLSLTGDVSHPKLTGNIEVASGRVEVDRLLRALQGDPLALVAETDLPAEGITPVDLRADAAAAAAADAARVPGTTGFDSQSFLSSLAVDVQVLAPDNLILRGSKLRPGGRNSWSLGDLNVTVGGDLQATRVPGEPVRLRGDVTAVRGVYSFESRRFEIQRGGRIRFQGESPMDPTFDVRGVRDVQGVEARVDVRGRLSEPRLQLGSNLPLDEADVLSMIIFNRPVNQLGDTQRADLVGAAASLAGGFVTSPLAQSLGRALDLDLLEVETVSFGQNVAPRVRVGQQLTSRLFVQLSQTFGAQSVSELTAEFQLAKFLRLQGSTAQGPGSRAQRSLLQRTERAALDLLFFFNY